MAEEKELEAPTAASAPPVEAAPPTPEKPVPPPEGEDWATRFKYLLADFENFRKRAARERDSLGKAVRADVALALLPTYEAAARAREAVARLSPNDPVRRGVELLAKELASFFENEHVTPVARLGEPFRSEWHEAVAEARPRENAPEGTVLEVVQQGYRADSILLRPAKVVVARALPASTSAAAATEATSEPDASDSG